MAEVVVAAAVGASVVVVVLAIKVVRVAILDGRG